MILLCTRLMRLYSRLAWSHLPAEHYVEVMRRLSLSVNILSPGVAVLRHAVGERPDFRVGPVFRQRERVLEKVDLYGVNRESMNQRVRRQRRTLSAFVGTAKNAFVQQDSRPSGFLPSTLFDKTQAFAQGRPRVGTSVVETPSVPNNVSQKKLR